MIEGFIVTEIMICRSPMVHLHRLINGGGSSENALQRTLTMTFPGPLGSQVEQRSIQTFDLNMNFNLIQYQEQSSSRLADLDRQLCIRCLSKTTKPEKCAEFCAAAANSF